MRIINDVEFSADDINEYKNIIYMNIIKGKLDSIILSLKVYYAKAANHSFSSLIPCIGLQVLVVGRKQLNIKLADSQLEAEGNKLILFDAFSIVDSDNFYLIYMTYLRCYGKILESRKLSKGGPKYK